MARSAPRSSPVLICSLEYLAYDLMAVAGTRYRFLPKGSSRVCCPLEFGTVALALAPVSMVAGALGMQTGIRFFYYTPRTRVCKR